MALLNYSYVFFLNFFTEKLKFSFGADWRECRYSINKSFNSSPKKGIIIFSASFLAPSARHIAAFNVAR